MAAASRPFDPLPFGKWPGPAVAAIKAVAAGNPRPDQCTTFMNFLLEDLCALYDEPFRPDDLGGDRATCFALGRAYPARQIRKAITQSFEKLVGKTEKVSKEQE